MKVRSVKLLSVTLAALLLGFVIAVMPAANAATSSKNYWLLSSSGQVFAYGKAKNYGSEYRKKYKGTITAIKSTPNGKGYWIITTKTYYRFGDASKYKYSKGATTKYTGKAKPKGLHGKIISIATAKVPTTTKTTTTTKTATTPTTTTTTTTAPNCSTVAINLSPSTHIVAQDGVPYTQTLAATGPTGTWTWSTSGGTVSNGVDISQLPPGLTLNSSGVLSGTPTGYNNGGWITFTATDSACPNNPASVEQFIDITEADMAITTTSLNPGQGTVAYTSQTLTATGGDGTYDWSAAGLPSGLSLSTAGVLSGTPASSDASSGTTNYTVDVTATDGDGEVPAVSRSYTLTITPAALTFTTTTLTAVQGNYYSGSIVMTGGISPYQLSLAAGSTMPAGLTLDNGTITGTPTAAPGTYTVTIQVADSQTTPYQASETFTMAIAPPGVAPNTTVTSTSDSSENNWSGYVEQGSTPFTSVSGTFTVPSAPYVVGGNFGSAWTGIDGYGNNTIVQAGVSETSTTTTGQVLYQAWWETYPSAIQNIFDVSPGDTINVYIWQVTTGEWEITLNDTTNGQGFAVEEPYSGPGATAEWIMEGSDSNPTPFYNGTITFTNLAASSAGTGAIEVLMDDVFGVSTPSAFNSVGFSVASSATAPPPP